LQGRAKRVSSDNTAPSAEVVFPDEIIVDLGAGRRADGPVGLRDLIDLAHGAPAPSVQ
jgi:hypothetical protein